jgi:hypothetical protein
MILKKYDSPGIWKVIFRENSFHRHGKIFYLVSLHYTRNTDSQAIKKYPDLNKISFNTTVISTAPEHTSWKYYRNGRDYLIYLGKGKYKLREKTE